MKVNGQRVRARRPGHDGHFMVVHHLLAAKIASKISAVVPAYHNNHGVPDHQTRARPRACYALAPCAAAPPLELVNKPYTNETSKMGSTHLLVCGEKNEYLSEFKSNNMFFCFFSIN